MDIMDSSGVPASGEYLTFTLGKEEYGIDILKVQEIRGYEAVTRIANAPTFIKGVINLRGVIVPIVDLRIKFNLGNPATTSSPWSSSSISASGWWAWWWTGCPT